MASKLSVYVPHLLFTFFAIFYLFKGYLNLSIQVYQYSLRCNVDQFFLQKIPLIVASNFTKAASHFGVYQNGSISLSFRVSCAQKFSGPSFYANCSDSVHTCCKNSCLNGGTCNVSQAVHIGHV